jgi:hypothetical protein
VADPDSRFAHLDAIHDRMVDSLRQAGLPSSSTSRYSFSLYSPTTDSTRSRTASTEGPSQTQIDVEWSGVAA